MVVRLISPISSPYRSEEMWDASGVRGGEPMNGAAAQRSATDLGSLSALTDDVDVMSINITCAACCMEGPNVRIARQNDISPFLPLVR